MASTERPHSSPPSACDEAHLVDAERGHVEGLADALATLDLDEQHPLAQAGEREASAAATEVLPTPPLPVTTCSRTPSTARESGGVATAPA